MRKNACDANAHAHCMAANLLRIQFIGGPTTGIAADPRTGLLCTHAPHPGCATERRYSPLAGCLITIRCHAEPSSVGP